MTIGGFITKISEDLLRHCCAELSISHRRHSRLTVEQFLADELALAGLELLLSTLDSTVLLDYHRENILANKSPAAAPPAAGGPLPRQSSRSSLGLPSSSSSSKLGLDYSTMPESMQMLVEKTMRYFVEKANDAWNQKGNNRLLSLSRSGLTDRYVSLFFTSWRNTNSRVRGG